jgi:hypothetical protein
MSIIAMNDPRMLKTTGPAPTGGINPKVGVPLDLGVLGRVNNANGAQVDPSKYKGTQKSYAEAQQILGTPQNTAVLNDVRLDPSINPQAAQLGQAVAAQRGTALGAGELAAKYGNINYDQQAIQGLFNDATTAEYAAKRKEYDRSAGQYYNRLATSQDSYLASMRKANAGAVASGANTGMQNANMLSAMLGMSQQSSADATKLAQDSRALADQEAAARTKNAVDALTQANATKLQLGSLGVQLAGVDAQQYAAELGHNAQVQSANTAAGAQQYASDRNLQSSVYNADANLAGQKYASDTAFNSSTYGSQANLYGNMYGSDQNLKGTKYAADQNLKGSQAMAAAQRAAAGAAASAARYAADKGAATAKLGADAQVAAQVSANNAMLTNTLLQGGNISPQLVIDAIFK